MGNEKKRLQMIIGTISLVALLIVGLVGYGIYWAFFDMNRLPTGEYLTEESSPDGQYTVKAYLVNGGATTSYTVRGELVFNEKKQKTKTIYWNDQEEEAQIEWLDEDTVVINGHTLDVPKDRFDFRRQ